MRDANSRTLESDDVDEYVAEFNQAVIDRMPRFGLETKNLISKSPNHGL